MIVIVVIVVVRVASIIHRRLIAARSGARYPSSLQMGTPARQTTEADYQRRLLLAQLWVQERLDETIDPAALAKATGFSLHHFHRIFRAQLGETVMQYVRRLRLERAARRLRATETRILDVAFDAGYESHEAFTRAFIERFGTPPSVFREQPSQRLQEWLHHRTTDAGVSVEVRTLPALRVAFMRHRGSYGEVGSTWQRMRSWASAQGLLGADPTLYGLCPDDPEVTEEARLRFDACVVIEDGFCAPPEVGVATIPLGTYAIGVHRGPYTTLAETYLDVIGRWFPTSGYEPAPDAVVEHYLDDPRTTPIDELRTEVRVRIAE